MADFNPANGQIRHSWETVVGIPDEANWHDHEFVSEALSPEYGKIQPNSITKNAQIPAGQPSKIHGGGDIPIEWDPEGPVRYLANLQKKGSVANPTAGVYVHKLAPSETAVTFPSTMSVEVSRDDGAPQINKGGRVGSASFSVAPSSFLTGAISLIPERQDYWAKAARIDVLGGGAPSDPKLRGIPAYANWTDAVNGDLYIKATAVTGTTVTLKAKVGSGASYGSTTFVVTVGLDSQGRPRWTDIIDSTSGLRVGSRDLANQLYIAAVTNWAVDSEFSFARERTVWTPVLPAVPKFNEIFAQILVGDSLATAEGYEIDSFDLTITQPTTVKDAIGGRFPHRVKQRGRRAVTGSIKREYLDKTLRKRLERAVQSWLRVDFFTGVLIGATAYESSMSLISGGFVEGGKTPSIGGQDSMDENYDFTCHPGTDVTYPDDLTVLITNSIATLAT
jgi:hypothetical protein